MSQWETILNKSSHTSPVKIVPPKNYSAERVEQYLKAMSEQPVADQSNKTQKQIKKRWSVQSIVFLLLVLFIPIYVWQCQQDHFTSNYTCAPVRYLSSPYTLQEHIWNQPWMTHVRHNAVEWIDRSRIRIQPYTEKLDTANHWIEKTTLRDLIDLSSQYARQLFYTEEDQLRVLVAAKNGCQTYLLPWWTLTKTWSLDKIHQWRVELDNYVKSGQREKKTYTQASSTEDVVEDKLRKTAKRILEYIDQKTLESKKMGMKQEEAKLKAQEIIESIMQETKRQAPEPMSFVFENTMDRVAFEIQSIMETAAQQKDMLHKQLDLIQERIKALDKEQDLSFLVHALKAEVDQLRMVAENSVRERTRQALHQLEETHETNPSVQSHIKKDFQTAQRAALKDLREAYLKLYRTNQEIDQLAVSSSTTN